MTDWREHNGGPQPVGDDVWVEASPETPWDGPAKDYFWSEPVRYRIINQHLIDAALKRGIELGLDAAAKVADLYSNKKVVSHIRWLQPDIIAAIQKPDTIAKETQHD